MRVLFIWNRSNSLMGDSRWMFYGSLAVATVAEKYGANVSILDRRVNPGDAELEAAVVKADAVFVTVTTADVPQAWEVFAVCVKIGVPCFMGGPHVCSSNSIELELPEGAILIVGDGMAIIPTVLSDLKANAVKAAYRSSSTFRDVATALDVLPPDRNLLSNAADYQPSLLTSLGCPNACTFCFDANTGTHRRQPLIVANELRSLKEAGIVGMFDDNLIGNDAEGVIELATALQSFAPELRFFGNADIRVLLVPNVLRALRQAGMVSIYIGFESVMPDTLKIAGKLGLVRSVYEGFYGKRINGNFEQSHVERLYHDGINLLHDIGFVVYGGLICGWPHEEIDSVESLYRFAESGPDVPWLSVATPYPGTALRLMLTRSGTSLESFKGGRYDTNHLTFSHERIAEAELVRAMRWYYGNIGSGSVVANKLISLAGPRFDRGTVAGVSTGLAAMKSRAEAVFV